MSERATVLIVDDDKSTRDGLERALKWRYNVLTAESGERALRAIAATAVDVLLSDVRMPGIDGVVLIQRALAQNPALMCILLTAYGSVELAVDAMKKGAYDFLTKPINLDQLDLVVQRALRARNVEAENVNLHLQLDRKYQIENIIGQSPAMASVFDVIRQAAPTQATALISGESGTGKELVALAIHRLSSRSKGPFVAVHCAALSASLLESELFGHERGAFTGAEARKTGRFERADGGTLFLDEISEIEPSMQVKLLRVLEERSFERVGGTTLIEVDIRLVAATNRNLRDLVSQGKFREDLFFRVDVVDIHLPPLREREGDIPLLCAHYLKEFATRNGKAINGITPEAMNALEAYSWPGNVRELRNTIEKMVVLSRGERLALRDIPPAIRHATEEAGRRRMASVSRLSPQSSAAASLAETERQLIIATLERHNQNRTSAARELGISRRTLHRKLNQYASEPHGMEPADAPPGAKPE